MLSNSKLGLLMEYYEATNIDTLRARSVVDVDTDIYNDMADEEFMHMVVEADRHDDFEIMRQIEERYKYFENKGDGNMDFLEAMKALVEGKKVRRVYWDEDVYIMVDEYGNIVDNDDVLESFNIKIDDKWEIYKEKKEVMDEKFKKLYHLIKDEEAYLNRQYEDFITEHKLEDHLTAFYRQLLEMNKYYKLDE